MPSDHPIACSLSAAELPARLAEIAAVGEHSLMHAREENGRAVLRFRPGAETRRRLEAIVAAESECCSFLDISLSEDAAALTLEVAGPGEAEPIVGEMVATFEGRHSRAADVRPQAG